ncbi:uncharacterized protein TRAVEDRAFT_69910 [Trametes versicolor FP-101664 SS1]|uniref:uncharacterized protein n=1 Tax=Trametes versicolor (strain FP-101664) TaxID=717944 RepID=UPI0004622BDF|nr:uncharacterized protein TRAVEDRAFT_69910 [Trametes versicolor FP-101664 SS1]EIW61588.1 hypothetical protein TRAVEDRAFT_69910 [Trametes versicolor FP-101664 SS1]
MSAATVAEPFLLSSYPDSAPHRKLSAVPVYASLPSTSDADFFVTVAVHGDGIHVLDTSTLHPAVSHTLGPSTSFAGPPASRTTHKSGSRVCTTYAVLQTGPDVQPEGKGKTVVAWEESLSGGVMTADLQGEKNKTVAVAPHPVSHIYAPEYLPDAAVLVGPAGQVSVADKELRVQHTFTPQNQQASTLLKHFLFPSSTCSFLSPHVAASHRAVLSLFLKSGDISRVAIVGISEDGSLSSLGESALPMEETDIIDVSCSNSGFISVLLHSGTWHAFSLTTSPSSSLSVSSAAEPLRLQALTFTSPGRASEVSLAALTSSHVLLAGVSSGSPTEIVLLLWDLRYGVLVAQQAIPAPSTLPRPKKTGAIIRLSASSVPSADASNKSAVHLNGLLVLAPAPDRDPQAESTPARSTILVVPLTVPATSTIAAAMGRASAGARWISTKLPPNAANPGPRGPEMSPAARKALKEMRASINVSAAGNVAGAEAAFFEYFKPDNSRKAVQASNADAAEGRVAIVEYVFTEGALGLVLPAAGAQTSGPVTYSAKIVRHLLERRAVNSSMVDGGLLPALAAREDWETISLAMRTVSDLPETDVILLLSKVAAAHRRNAPADDSAMQVDATSSPTPALAAFLAQCVVYPFTPALQRVAVRKNIPDAADLLPVLQVLDGWIVQHTDDGALLAAAVPASELPPLDKVLAFLQPLLDASFLALLAYAPAHRLLRTLAAHLEPTLALTSALEHLAGPLEPFARAAAKAQARAAESKDVASKGDSGRDWRRKRKAAHEQAAVAVGLYQVEELVL